MPAPDAYKRTTTGSDSSVVQQPQSDTIPAVDFSSVIPDEYNSSDENSGPSENSTDSLIIDSSKCVVESEIVPVRYPQFRVPRNIVRVALLENMHQMNLYSAGAVSIHSNGRVFTPLRGRLHFQRKSPEVVIVENAGITKEIVLPCTYLQM